MPKEPLPIRDPIRVRVNKPGDAHDGQIGVWLGVSRAVLGPLVGKVLVEFPGGAHGAYSEGELTWVHNAPADEGGG
jgi:hypothetical protein